MSDIVGTHRMCPYHIAHVRHSVRSIVIWADARGASLQQTQQKRQPSKMKIAFRIVSIYFGAKQSPVITVEKDYRYFSTNSVGDMISIFEVSALP